MSYRLHFIHVIISSGSLILSAGAVRGERRQHKQACIPSFLLKHKDTRAQQKRASADIVSQERGRQRPIWVKCDGLHSASSNLFLRRKEHQAVDLHVCADIQMLQQPYTQIFHKTSTAVCPIVSPVLKR